MRALFFDTETTGLPKDKWKPATDGPHNWPEPVSISWILTEGPQILSAKSYIVQPNGWDIPKESIRIHGITKAFAEENGTPLKHILGEFIRDLRATDIVIAHNLQFDKNVILAAILYHVRETMAFQWPKHEFCTMEASRAICKLLTPTFSQLYKAPKLSELYEHTFKAKPPEKMLHTSFGDVQILVACFFEHWTLEQAASYVRGGRQNQDLL